MSEQSIFIEALEEQDPAQRAALLEQACAGDSDLRQRVERLLSRHHDAGSFLESPGFGRSSLAEGPGSVIGSYKLLQQIGEGGMGVVYMAEQTESIQRTVALKIIKPGMDTRQVIARFEAERQALAMMDHTNIAKVFDAGTTDNGRPYFVMELVKGVPITKYCDEKHLPVRARLELFGQVCNAVQHAHQKGIIHRDLKPTNVLVAEYDNRAVPKVIDFGVAKATAQKLTERTMFTEFGQMIGTVEYMSPEQTKVYQLDIDTRSDVYSLGVLLYELLTGSTPFERLRLREAAFDECLRIIREEEPPKPSTRLTSSEALPSIAANRHTEPARLSKDLRGELDWIVMKALDKDRGRRYETANGLAQDIGHYLADEPVQACPPSAAYRFGKVARRNKTALLTAALVVVMLLAGVVLLAVNNVRLNAEQARTRAETERTKAQFERAQTELARADRNLGTALAALDRIFITAIEDRTRHDHKLTAEDRRLVENGLAFYEQFAADNSAHADLPLETARAHRRVGDVQLWLAHWPEAESAYRRAIAVLENIRVQSPDSKDYQRQIAASFEGLSRALWQQQRTDDARKAAERALPLWEVLAADTTAKKDDRSNLAHFLAHQAMLLAHYQRYDEAEQTYRRVLDAFAKLKKEFPQERGYRQEWAYAQTQLAYWVLRPTARLPEAEQHYREAIAAYRALAEEAPDDSWYPRCVANELHNLGDLFKQMRKFTEAEGLYREAIEVQEKIIARGPSGINEHRHLLSWYLAELARLLAQNKRFSEAEAGFQRSATIRQTIIADLTDPDDERERQNQRRLLSLDYMELIWTVYLSAEQAATDGARPEEERKGAATRARARAREAQREATLSGRLAAGELNALVWRIVRTPGSDAEDVAWAVEMARKAVELSPTVANFWGTLGVAEYRAGDFQQAVARIEKSRQLRNGGSSYDFFFLAMANWQLGDKDEARDWYSQGLQWMQKNQTQNEELRRFQTEAEELLKIADENTTTKPVESK